MRVGTSNSLSNQVHFDSVGKNVYNLENIGVASQRADAGEVDQIYLELAAMSV